MLSINPKIAFTNILEGGLPPTAINGHFDRYIKTIISERLPVLYDRMVSMTRMTDFQTLPVYFSMN